MIYTLEQILIKKSSVDWISDIQAFCLNWNNDNQFVHVKTSGSTGAPKTIPLSKSAMIKSAKNTILHFNIPSHANALLCMPTQFIAGKMMLVRAQVGHWHLKITEPKSAIAFENQSFDFVAMTPHQVISSINKYGLTQFNNVNTLIIGGGEIPLSALELIKNLPCRVFNTYGMTETITHVATKNISAGDIHYKALPNIKFTIDNRSCLKIHTNYLEDPVQTNDIVSLNNPYSFEWQGRFDFVVNSGGLKIHPEKLAQKLSELIDSPFFFHGIKHDVLGQQLILVLSNNQQITETILIIKKNLPKVYYPKQIWLLPRMIYTENNKINRSETLKQKIEIKAF